MPHQCTNCGRTFPDGSKEMLSGCPDCGGNKFQFAPSSGATAAGGASEPNAGAGGERTGATEPSARDGSDPDADGVASRAAETVRGWVSSNSTDESTGASTVDTGSTSAAPENAARARESEVRSSSSETRSGTDPTAEGDGFSEWPDSARRPEDRSSGAEQSETDQSAAARSSPDEATAAQSVTDDRPAAATDVETNAHSADVREAGTDAPAVESEDSAQASARSDVVPADDLPTNAGQDDDSGAVTDVGGTTGSGAGGGSDQPPNDGRVVSEPTGEQPSIEDLRAELNEQFESIKIVRPGQYELNLMELYNRDEYIISLQEDGRYVIDVPDSWHDSGEE
ncbi:OapC/ArvC family zinc-ribbon domain-containing protein [Natronococcus wangiae]|uniref:OapC/ArvC family zinc-ribbon domain-containing protein n=1 Tax=Natronococcus wangiae TaxID=3068275 RepID=UPI00273F4500|nr:Zn-ribbon containing protein [Natronococcus sp. AD5]